MDDFAGGSQPHDYDQDPNNPGHNPPWKESDDADDAGKARAGVKLPDGTTIQGYSDGGTSPHGTVYPDGKTDGGMQGGLSITIPFGGDSHSHGSGHTDAPSSSADDGTGGTYEPATPGTYEHPSGYCISDAGDQYRTGEVATLGDGNQYQCFEGSWIPLADPNVEPAGDDSTSSDAYASSYDGSDQSDEAASYDA